MPKIIKLTQGAYNLLSRRYRAVLIKCCMAAAGLNMLFAAPVIGASTEMADIPAAGSSFTINDSMLFKDVDISYGYVKGPDHTSYTLILDNSNVRADHLDMGVIDVNGTDSTLESLGRFAVKGVNLTNSSLLSKGHLSLAGPLHSLGGDNTLKSDADIGLMYGVITDDSSTLSLISGDTVMAGGSAELSATNLSADSVEIGSPFELKNLNLKHGGFTTTNIRSPNMIFGSMSLMDMETNVGGINVFGKTDVKGGSFVAKDAMFSNESAFNGTDVSISSLSATDFRVSGGKLEIGLDSSTASVISGDLTLRDVDANIGVLKIGGKTEASGGSMTADTLTSAGMAMDNFNAQIKDLSLAGPLSLANNTWLKTQGSGLSDSPVKIDNSKLDLHGDYTASDLEINGGELAATGNLRVDAPVFKLQASKISGQTITTGDFSSSGKSQVEAVENIKAENITLDGGSLNLNSPRTVTNSILGSGSLTASNLEVKNDLSLKDGDMALTGNTVIGGDLSLDSITATTDDITVDGAALLASSQISGKNIIFSKNTTLDNGVIKADSVKIGDISTSGASGVESAKDLTIENAALNTGSLQLHSPRTGANSILGSGSLTASNLEVKNDLSLKDGDMALTGNTVIGGDLSLDSITSTTDDITVDGATLLASSQISGKNIIFSKNTTLDSGVIKADSVKIGDISASGASGIESAQDLTIENAALNTGSLQLHSPRTVANSILGSGSLTASNLEVKNDLSLKDGDMALTGNTVIGGDLSLDSITANVGDINIHCDALLRSSSFNGGNIDITGLATLDAAFLAGDAVTMNDIAASGINRIEAKNSFSAGNVNMLSGRMSFVTPQPIVQSIRGIGSIDAHNLNVKTDLSLANGEMHLTGSTLIGDNLNLENVNAAVEDMRVKGDANLSASGMSGRNITFDKGATLDKGSLIEAQRLVTGGDIILYDNSEILSGDINLGDGDLVLDGATSKRVMVAVGRFGGGDVTIDANSMLSIGADTPDWVNMGMAGHQANAALGLWTPFELGSGANASIGVGSLSRRNSRAAGANQINFTSDSLLITNAQVASKNGRGAISAAAPAVANVGAGAKLHILSAQKDGLYRVLGENIQVNYEGNAWQGDNVKTDSILLKLERLGGDKLGWFEAKASDSSSVLPPLDPGLGDGVDDGNNSGNIPPESGTTPTPPPNKPSTPIQPTPPQPDNPEPDVPSTPDDPETPDIPSNPENPGTPEGPSTPENPEGPDNPSNPEPPQPDNPENPGTPGNPNQPGTPDNPKPDNPNEPSQPDNPGGKPENPEPDEPNTPQEPEPDEPENPTEPEEPTEPELPPVKTDYTPGQLFLSRATNFWFIGHDAWLAARTIESAGRIFALGAVPEMTLAANQAASAAMAQRTGGDNNYGLQAMSSEGEILNNAKSWHGFAMWISPLYKSVNGYSLTSGNWNADINGGLGGIALGGDYTFANKLRFGLSFNIGGGYSQSGGELAQTTNNMSFWGLGAYGGWSVNNFSVSGDVSFTSTYNKLKQELPDGMRMDDLKSDITARAISAGMEFAYLLPTSFVDIKPHAGARYAYIYNDSYDVNSGGTVLEGKAGSQNIWTFPVGLSFEKEIGFANGWSMKPIVDFSVIPAAGDKKARSEVRFTGTNPWATLKDQIMDDISYRGSLGLQFETGNFALGINYSMQAGMKTNSQTVMGSFAYTF